MDNKNSSKKNKLITILPYILIPILISTIIALCDNGRNVALVKKYTNLVNNKREELIEIRSNIEVTIGFVSIFGVFLKINSILTPILYWQAMKFKYSLNPYIKKSFSQLNYSSNQFKNSETVEIWGRLFNSILEGEEAYRKL